MMKVHNILESLREATLDVDAEFAHSTMADIRNRLDRYEVDLNSGDWDSAIGHINNYLYSWLERRASGKVIKRHYDDARKVLRVPDTAQDVDNWLRDLKDYVLPVMNSVYGH